MTAFCLVVSPGSTRSLTLTQIHVHGRRSLSFTGTVYAPAPRAFSLFLRYNNVTHYTDTYTCTVTDTHSPNPNRTDLNDNDNDDYYYLGTSTLTGESNTYKYLILFVTHINLKILFTIYKFFQGNVVATVFRLRFWLETFTQKNTHTHRATHTHNFSAEQTLIICI